MRQEFINLMNEVQEYRKHKAENDPDVSREYGYLRARIERTWREGHISMMQMDTLTAVMEERR